MKRDQIGQRSYAAIGSTRMRGCLRAVIITIISLVSISASFGQEVLPAIVKKIQPSIVVILTYDNNKKPIAQGSGFFISKDGDVITNRHVLRGAKSADVKTVDGKVYAVGNVIADDKNGDLVRIRVASNQASVRYVPISSTVPEVGQRIFVIGSPLGLEQTVTDGIVSAVRQIPSFGNIIQISAPISHGSSGSPVVNLQGEVVGVASFGMIEGQNLNFAIPGPRVIGLILRGGTSIANWNLENAKVLYEHGKKVIPDPWERLKLLRNEPEETKKKIAEAIGFFNEAIAADPTFIDGYIAIADGYESLEIYKEAAAILEQAISIIPNKLSLYFELEDQYRFLNDIKKSVMVCDRILEMGVNSAEECRKLGMKYTYNACLTKNELIRAELFRKAIDLYWQAIRIKPDDIFAYNLLGMVYLEQKLYPYALEAFRQAIRCDPDDITGHVWLKDAYEEMGDKKSAQKEDQIIKKLLKD